MQFTGHPSAASTNDGAVKTSANAVAIGSNAAAGGVPVAPKGKIDDTRTIPALVAT